MKKREHANAKLIPEGERCCPICGDQMTTETQSGVSIDACHYHGIWLDNGELKKITLKQKTRLNAKKRKAVTRASRDGKMTGVIRTMFFGFWGFIYTATEDNFPFRKKKKH